MPGVPIGLDELYYAPLTQDNLSGVAYGTPVRITGAIKANMNPNSSLETLFADNGPMEVASTLGMIGLELNVADLPAREQGALLGHTVNAGMVVKKAGDVPPWLAIGYRTLKSNGFYRYTWLVKGKFSEPESSNETKADKVTFQPPTINGNFVKREFDDVWERTIDSDHPDYVPSVGDNWFTAVEGAGDTAAPTVTIVPADAATAVAVGSTVAWTFSEALQFSTITGANFLVMAAATGVQVAGTLSANAGRTIVTFTPTSALDAATDYIAMATTNVKDLAGNALAANSITNFRTA